MPELPEVETTLRGIEEHVLKQEIKAVDIRNGRLRWPVSEELYELKSERIHAIHRRAKYIVLELKRGAILIHLGMSGSLRLSDAKTPLRKHDHVIFSFQGHGLQLRFHDPRRFGCILWTEDWQNHPLISHLGPEPLTEDFSGKYLYGKAKGRKTSIKALVMDAKIVVGVGNIYANEALFLSGVSPKRQAGQISKLRMERLVSNIKLVLSSAIDQGGTTLRDFVNSDGSPGYFKQSLHVYGKAGQDCSSCGATLLEIRQNNRSTVYCKHCQK